MLPPLTERILPLLAGEDRAVYIVGGTVRDMLLGRDIHDLDLTVDKDAIPLTFRLADALGVPAYVLDSERDVGRILLTHDETTLDIASFRGPSLEDDLYDRDFTVNAMALPVREPIAGKVIDLHNGLEDLGAKRLRAIHERSIENDPVRALRAARFAEQLGFELTDETRVAARAIAPTLMERTSPERIRDEINRMLASRAPQQGMAFADEMGLLAYVLPEVVALKGVDQSPPHHEDVYHHTLSLMAYLIQIEDIVDGGMSAADWAGSVLDTLAPYRPSLKAHLNRTMDGGVKVRLLLRWGGLLHDIGKARTQTVDPSGRIRFLGHGEVGAEIASNRFSVFSFSNEAARHVRSIVEGHMRPLHLADDGNLPTRRAAYRYFRALRTAGLDVGLISIADHLATYGGIVDQEGWPALLNVVRALFETYFSQYDHVVAPPRLLDGRQVMDLLDEPPGQEIGRLLRLLEEAQAAGEVTTQAEAIDFVLRHNATK